MRRGTRVLHSVKPATSSKTPDRYECVMAITCNTCKRTISKKYPGVRCGRCCQSFHSSCAEVRDSEIKLLESNAVAWFCMSCRKLGLNLSGLISDDSDDANAVSPFFTNIILQNLKEDIIKGLSSKFKSVQESADFCSNKITDFELKLNTINNQIKIIETLKQENIELRATTAELSRKVDNLEQYSRLNNVVINNFPERSNENIFSIAKDIANTAGIDFNEEVEYGHRVPHQNRDNRQPRSIVLRFVSRRKKESFLSSAKKCKNLSTTDLKIEGPQHTIYVNDHLTPFNNYLFKKARDSFRQHGYKYIWTRNCKIFVRKSDTTGISNITSEVDISRLLS